MSEEKAYWTHEIAKYLDISYGTLRKWCIELEKQNYKFAKGENNSRAFTVREHDLLINIKQHLRTTNSTIESAVQQALKDLESLPSNGQRTPLKTLERGSFEQEFMKLNKRLDQQEEFNQKILERMEERDKNLMIVLNEIQQNKKLAPAKKERKKRWWIF
ncbi:DUF3967 domain-containing protein [Pseudogracilibacillus sp. SO10305]|uniref:DUF3967 domain-containing protein n=1 Tax=Pseudogracilibacillus sp. SO10305 TaxID=3098292 RepID=UPI00300DF713